MKRFSSIRAKLLLIVLVPTMAMTALGVRQVAAEAGEVRALEQRTRVVSLFDSIPPAIDAMGRLRLDMERTDDPPAFGVGTPRAAVADSLNRFYERAALIGGEGGARFGAALSQALGVTRSVDLNAPSPRAVDLDAAADALTELAGAAAFETSDPALSRDLSSVASLTEYLVVARRDERILLEYSQSGMDSARHGILVVNRTRGDDALRSFESIASPTVFEDVNGLTANSGTQNARNTIDRLILDGPKATTKVPVDFAFSAVDASANGVQAKVGELSRAVVSEAVTARDRAQRELWWHLLLVAGIVGGAVALAVIVARSISSRLRRVAVAAADISDVRLPNFLQAVANPDLPLETIETDLPALGTRGNDEVGQVMDAFEKVQEATVAVAREHASRLRNGIDSTFVNLARRNQTTVTRQLEAVDWLRDHQVLDKEATARLGLVEQLGHSLQRNAENLLVLSGVELGSKGAQPLEAGALIRRTAREIGDSARVTVIGMTDLEVEGAHVDDVRRVLVELLDNAFQFSPPTERIIISLDEGQEGHIVVSVRDHGVGMTAGQLQQANALLGGETNVGLEMSRRLGLTVVGTIARRIGATVALSADHAGGVTARITLASRIFVETVDRRLPGADDPDHGVDLTEPAGVSAQATASDRSREAVLARLAAIDPKSLVDQHR